MIRELLIMVCSTVYAHAGILGTDFSPASDVSYSSFSLGSATPKTVESHIVQPAITQEIVYEKPELSPIYETVLNTEKNKYNAENGFEQTTFSKSLNTGNLRNTKFIAQSSRDGVYSTSFGSPVYTEAVYQAGSYSQEPVAPVNYVSAPLESSATYAEVRPLAAISKPPPSYSIGASNIIYSSKVTPGLSAFGSSSDNYDSAFNKTELSSEKQLKSFSDTPVVSHVTYSDSKTSYK